MRKLQKQNAHKFAFLFCNFGKIFSSNSAAIAAKNFHLSQGEKMAKSSANLQKATKYSLWHNFRKGGLKSADYLLPKELRKENEYWENPKSEKEIFYTELQKIKGRTRGKMPKFENSRCEVVVNLNENHTLTNAQEVAEHIAKKFNFHISAIAIHRDEGHLVNKTTGRHLSPGKDYYTDPQGNSYYIKNGKKTKESLEPSEFEAVYNYHAHINFITYKDQKQNWRMALINPPKLRQLQTEIAEILQMERGVDKRISKKERLTHKQLKDQEHEKEALKSEILTLKEIKAEFEKIRQESKGQGLTADLFKDLSERKKKALAKKDYTREQLEADIQAFKAKCKKKILGIETTDKDLIIDALETNLLKQHEKANEYKSILSDIEANQAEIIETIRQDIENENKAVLERLKSDLENEAKEALEIQKQEQEKDYKDKTLFLDLQIAEATKQIKIYSEANEQMSESYLIQQARNDRKHYVSHLENEYAEAKAKLEAEKKKREKLEAENDRLKRKLERALLIIKNALRFAKLKFKDIFTLAKQEPNFEALKQDNKTLYEFNSNFDNINPNDDTALKEIINHYNDNKTSKPRNTMKL